MGDPSYVYPAPDMPPYDRGPAVVTDENQSQSLQSDHSRGSFGPQRFANTLASGPVWKSNIQPDFNVRVIERFGPDSFAVLRELHESNRFVQKSAESTSI